MLLGRGGTSFLSGSHNLCDPLEADRAVRRPRSLAPQCARLTLGRRDSGVDGELRMSGRVRGDMD